jgi:hypothetical protein
MAEERCGIGRRNAFTVNTLSRDTSGHALLAH